MLDRLFVSDIFRASTSSIYIILSAFPLSLLLSLLLLLFYYCCLSVYVAVAVVDVVVMVVVVLAVIFPLLFHDTPTASLLSTQVHAIASVQLDFNRDRLL